MDGVVKLVSLGVTDDSSYWSASPPARDNTIKLTMKDPSSKDPNKQLCADVSFMGSNLKLSKCDDKSKSQRFTLGH